MPLVFALAFFLLVWLADEGSLVAHLLAPLLGFGVGTWLSLALRRRDDAAAPPAADADRAAVFAALEDIHWRLKRLEEARGLGPSPMEAEQAQTLELDAAVRDLAGITAAAPSLPPAAVPVAASTPSTATPAGPVAPPAASPAAPAATAGSGGALPGTLEQLVQRARDWLLGGNTVVRAGIVVLFFGVAFLLKFALDRGMLSAELRVAGTGAGAIALLAIGWHLRVRRTAYGLALQGAGVGLLYLTFFGAFRLYHLLPAPVALVALVAVAGLSALLALRQDAPALMGIGVTGGFLAPLLASTGSGNHVALFSYYLVLNLGIFAVAWVRAWRPLNLLGFFFTVAIGLLWGGSSYTPDRFASTEPFLIAFFALFLTVSVRFALRQGEALGDWAATATAGRLPPRIVDGTLVFGLPLVAFGFQAGMLRHSAFGLAYSALALAATYLALAHWLRRQAPAALGLLRESFLALGVIFATLAIPLALDARWTSASWAVEGAALVWVGLHQRRRAGVGFGLLLQAAAALAWLVQPGYWSGAAVPVANAWCLGAVLIAGAGLFSAWQLQTRQQPPSALAPWLFAWGLGWWLLAGLGEASRQLEPRAWPGVAALFLAATAAGFARLEKRLAWPHALWPGEGLAIGLAWLLLYTLGSGLHAFAAGGWLAWPLALAVHAALLRARDRDAAGNAEWALAMHALGFWTLAALGSHELHWLAREQALAGGWRAAAVILPPALLLFLAARAPAARWPLTPCARAYLGFGAWPLLAASALWMLVTNLGNAADPAPLPWLPLLNPVDLAHACLGLAALAWARRAALAPDTARALPPRAAGLALAGGFGFLWLNAVLLRSVHHWTSVPYTPADLMASTLVQATLSLSWTLLALVLMATGARRGLRALWMTGAVLMAVVVAKLFLVDLERVGSVARIVSFVGVGLLMLLIGYLAPVPPRTGAGAGTPTPEA